jgi:hypothetical protein
MGIMDYELAFASPLDGKPSRHSADRDARAARRLSLRWIGVAAVYFVAGVALGIVMGMTHDFTLRAVHAHINLLGWVSSALFGVIYLLLPHLATTRLARVHFWLYNCAVPVAIVALTLALLGYREIAPLVGLSSFAIGVAVLVFAGNVLSDAVKSRGRENL